MLTLIPRLIAIIAIVLTAMNTSVCAQFLCNQDRQITELAAYQVANSYPFLTADGLTVYWVKGTVLYSATRASITSNFAAGVQVSGLTTQTSITGCWVSEDQLSIYFTRGSVLYNATRTSSTGSFGTPQTISLPGTLTGTICSPSLTPDLNELFVCIGPSSGVTAVYSLQRVGTTLVYTNPIEIPRFLIAGYYTSPGQLSKDGLSFYNSVGSYNQPKRLSRYRRATLTSAWDYGIGIPWQSPMFAPTVMSPSVSTNERTFIFVNESSYPYLYTATIKSTQLPTLIPMPDGITQLRPLFQWRSVPGATQYIITIYHPSGAMSDYALDTFYTPTSNLSFGEIRWQLTSDNSGAAYDTFKLVDSRIPRIIPYQPEISGTPRPTFQWHPVVGATSYFLTAKVGNAGVISQNVADTFFTPQNDLPLNQITWNLTSNLSGTSSATDTFIVSKGTIPELIRFDGFQDTAHRPTFRWHPVSGYLNYTIRVSSNSDLLYGSGITTTTTDTFFTPSVNQLLSLGHSYWSVCYSPVGTFAATDSLFTAPALAPLIVAPYHDQYQFPLSGTFQWNTLPGISTYKFEIAENPAFTTKFQTTTSDTSYRYASLRYATRYYWRVAGYANGVNGIWGVDSFITDYPAAPKMIFPKDSSSGHQSTVAFRWNHIGTGITYRFTLGDDPYGNSNFLDTAGLIDTSFTVANLSGARAYYWSLQSAHNQKSMYGTQGSFSTALQAPKLLVPAHNVLDMNWETPFVFKWSGIYGARYKLQVDSNRTFSSPMYSASGIYDSTLTISSFNLPTLALNQYSRYFWRVQSALYYLTDSLSPWGIDSFYTSGRSGNIQNISPVNGARVSSDSITFRWRTFVPYSDKFLLIIASDTGLVNRVRVDTVTADTSFLISGLLPGRRYFWSVRALRSVNLNAYSSVFQLNTLGSTAVHPRTFDIAMHRGLSSNGTTINYALAAPSDVSIKILNPQGRLIQIIVSAVQPAGYYERSFNAGALSNGYYLLEFKAGTFKKIIQVLVK